MATTQEYKLRLVVESMVGKAIKELNMAKKSTTGLQGASKGLMATLGKTALKFASLTTVVAVFTKTMKEGTKEAINYNSELANIGTLIPQQEERLLSLKGTIKDLSIESGKSLEDLAQGTYQIISAFGDAIDTEEKLDIVTKGAIAGQADTTASLNLLSAVTKAYGDTSASALQKVSDLAFMTVKLGQTTFPELASSIQHVTAMSEMLNVTQEELFGAFSTLTGVTGSASEVATQLRGGLTALVSPSEDLIGLYEKLGVSGGEALVQQEGLQGAFAQIVKYSEETGKSLQSLVGRQQAMIVVQSLGSAQAETYARKFEEIQNATGATNTAFREVSEGINETGFALEQMHSLNKVILTQIGDKFTPALGGLAKAYVSIVGKISGNITAQSQLKTSTDKLMTLSSEYKQLQEDIATATDGRTKALKAFQLQEKKAEIQTTIDKLGDSYGDTTKKAKKYEETIEESNQVINERKSVFEGITKEMGIAMDKEGEWIDKLFKSNEEGAKAVGATKALWEVVKGSEYTESGIITMLGDYRDALEDVQQAELDLNNLTREQELQLGSVAQAVKENIVDIDYLAISYKPLYDEIMEVVIALEKQEKAQKGLSDNDYMKTLNQDMKQFIGYSSEALDKIIETYQVQLNHTRDLEKREYLEQAIALLTKQRVITLSEEAEIAKRYLETATANYEQQLFQLTVGEGLVQIENERAKAIEDAKKNHVDDADLLSIINELYDEQANQFKANLSDQLDYSLSIQNVENEIYKIEIERLRALEKLKEEGIEEQGIIDRTNQLYEEQKNKIIENEEEKWKLKNTGLEQLTEEEKIERNRVRAIEESNRKYGEQIELLKEIDKFYDKKLEDYKKERTLIEKVEDASKNVLGDEGYASLKKIQKGIGDINQLWSDLTPIISSISSAFDSFYDTQRYQREHEIKGLEENAKSERESADEELKILNKKHDEKIDALQEMYDNDAISYEDYKQQKLDIDKEAKEKEVNAEIKALEAENAVKMAQHEAEVAEFERNKSTAISNAIIAGAQGIMQAWALGPIVGMAGSAIIGGAMAYQISQISSQPSPPAPTLATIPTPFAEGGIVTGPTNALIGEAGEKEMVLPLSKAEEVGFGNKKQSDTYNITGNTFVGIGGVDELIQQMEERKKVLKKRNRL